MGMSKDETARLAEWERVLLDEQAAKDAAADEERSRLIHEVEVTEVSWTRDGVRMTVRADDGRPVILRWLLDEVRKLRQVSQ